MAKDPWEIIQSDERTENRLDTYIIFCEDENDEPYYFQSFQVEGKLKINCIPNQRQAKLNLLSTLYYCHREGLLEHDNRCFRLKEGITENIWCVYDRDVEYPEPNEETVKGDIDFSAAIKMAYDAGLKVAWSNDAFELWILLHFEDVPSGAKLNRTYLYGRLTAIFRDHPPIIEKFKESIEEGTFSYKKQLKRRKYFVPFVLPLLGSRMQDAAQRAALLESKLGKAVPYHDCNPCTLVYHLACELKNKFEIVT